MAMTAGSSCPSKASRIAVRPEAEGDQGDDVRGDHPERHRLEQPLARLVRIRGEGREKVAHGMDTATGTLGSQAMGSAAVDGQPGGLRIRGE